MVGLTPPEMKCADQRRARPGRGAWRRWRAVLCVALLAPLLPAAAGPVAAQSGGDVPGVGFDTTAEIVLASGESGRGDCYFGSIDPLDEMVPADKNRPGKRVIVSDENGQRQTTVPYADVDRVKVDLDKDTVYVFEVRGQVSGGGTLVDPELRGVYVNPNDTVGPYKMYSTAPSSRLWGHWWDPVGDSASGDRVSATGDRVVDPLAVDPMGARLYDDFFNEFLALYDGRIVGNGISGDEVDERNKDDDPETTDLPTEPAKGTINWVFNTYPNTGLSGDYVGPLDPNLPTGTTTLTIDDINDETRDHAFDLDDGLGQDAWMLFQPLESGYHFLQIEGSGGFFGSYKVLVYDANTDPPCEATLTIVPVDDQVYEGTDAEFLIHGSAMPGVPVELEYTYMGEHYFGTPPEVLGTQSMQLTGNGPWPISIPTIGDDVIEDADGSVTIKIINRVGYTPGTPDSATVVVQDDDGGPAISIEAVDSSVTEGTDTDAQFVITAEEIETPTDVTISYSYEGDFVASSAARSQVLPDLLGEGPWEVTVPIVDDDDIESEGSVTVAIERGDGYTVGIPASATVVVEDDDGGPPIITGTAAVQHSEGLPLWEARVYWDLPTDVKAGQVHAWNVQWARDPCGVRPVRWVDSGYTAASRPGFTAAELRESGFRWLTSDDSIHFRVKALFNHSVPGPYSEPACQAAPPEVAQPQATASFELLGSGVIDRHLGRGSLFPIDILFSPQVDISRADLHRALDVSGGTLKRSNVLSPNSAGRWTIVVTPLTDASIMTITLDCSLLQQCTVGDSVTVRPARP